ncbi:hypothetical protein Tco_1207923 [Tanacetum coccineum]
MEKLSVDLNVRKESSDSDEAAQYGGNPTSASFEIHNGGCFTPTPSRLGLDYGLHPLTIDVDVLELAKYAKDNKIILVKAPIEIDSSPDVNRNLTPMCHRKFDKIVGRGPIVVETDDPFDDFDEILGDYANTGKEIIRKEIIVHVDGFSVP